MYINTQTLQRVSEQEIRAAFPNTSFPTQFTPPAGYAVLFHVPQPTHDAITQGVREVAPVQVNDKWYQAWEIYELDAETIAANQAKAKADLVAQYDYALAKHLDEVAQSKRYDNRITCALRAGYPGPFQAEGQVFAAWMDTQNFKAYQIQADVESGKIEMPTVDEFISMLDPMVWPS